MALEGLINIRVYATSGAIDASLSGSASMYDNSLPSGSAPISTGTLVYNTTIGVYQYDFTSIMNLTKSYTVNIDFGAAASTRYANVGISPTITGSGATPQQIWEYPSKPLIVDLGDILKIL